MKKDKIVGNEGARTTMFQNIQDDVPIEIGKIQVALAFRGFVHQFPDYSFSLSNPVCI